jgi:hypothetical protein
MRNTRYALLRYSFTLTSENNYHVNTVYSFMKEAALTVKQCTSIAQRSLLLMRRLTISDLK